MRLKHVAFLLPVAVYVLGTAASLPAATTTAMPAISGRMVITGVVTDQQNAPVRAAMVVVRQGIRYVARLTDATGRYRIANLPPEPLHITVSGQGFAYELRELKPRATVTANFRLTTALDRMQLTGAEILSTLPRNDETRFLKARCIQCHGMTQLEHLRGAYRDAWLQTLATMELNYGRADITGPSLAYAADVATKYFGPDAPLLTESSIRRTPVSDAALNATFYMIDLVPTGKRALAHSIVADNDDGAWVSEAGNNRLTHWNLRTGELRSIDLERPNSVPHTPTIDRQGRIWTALIGTRQMSVIDPKTGQVQYFPLQSTPHTLSTDADGYVWGNGDKVYRMDPDSHDIQYWTLAAAERERSSWVGQGSVPGTPTAPASPLDAYHAVRDSKGMVWATSLEAGGLTRLDPKTGEQVRVRPLGVNGSRGIDVDADDNVWFSDWIGHNLAKYDPVTAKTRLFKLPTEFAMIYSVFVDRVRGHVWCADFTGNHLTRFDPRTEQFVEFPLPHNESYPRFISIDKQGRIWFAEWWNNRIGVMDPGDLGATSRPGPIPPQPLSPLAAGARLYQQYCGTCHLGGRVGPPLFQAFATGREQDFRKTITEGRGNMPGFRYTLDPAQIDRIVAYVQGLDQPATLITVPAAAAPSWSQGATPPLLTGTVHTVGGKPLTGVTVSARPNGAPMSVSVYTDAQGHYYFPPLPTTGPYLITAQLAGHRRAELRQSLGAGVQRADFSLRPSADFVRQLSGWQQITGLPEDTRENRRGKALVIRACTGCHQSSKLFTRRFDAAGWSAVIDAMGKLTPAGKVPSVFITHRQEIADYLAKVSGPGPSVMKLRLPPPVVGEALDAVVYEYDIANTAGQFAPDYGSDWSAGPPSSAGSGISIHDATSDQAGNLWFTSPAPLPGRTIGRLDGKTGATSNVAYPGDTPPTGRSHAVIAAPDGTIWFNIMYGKEPMASHLGTIDPQSGERAYYVVPKGMIPVGAWLTADGKNGIWTAAGTGYSGPAGALRFDRQSKQFEEFKSLQDGMTYGVAGDADGNGWWAQINEDRIYYTDRAKGTVGEIDLPFSWQGSSFLKPGDMSEQEYNDVVFGVGSVRGSAQMPRRLKADLKGNSVWVGNWAGNNLMRIDTKTRKLEFNPAPYEAMMPYDVGIDSQQRVWVGLQNGDEIARFDPATQRWTLYPLPTRGVSARSLDVVERAGHVEVIVPANDAMKAIRLVPRSASEAQAMRKQYYGSSVTGVAP
jgi:streptogramin lyase